MRLVPFGSSIVRSRLRIPKQRESRLQLALRFTQMRLVMRMGFEYLDYLATSLMVQKSLRYEGREVRTLFVPLRVYIVYPRVLCHGLRRRKEQSRKLTVPKAACCTPYRQSMDVTIHHSIRAPTLIQPSVGSQCGFVQNTCMPRPYGPGTEA